MTTYKIIRFHRDGPSKVVRRGLTKAQAQAHCKDPATHGEDWFDGYDVDTYTFDGSDRPSLGCPNEASL